MPPVRVAHIAHDLRAGGTERRMLSVLAGLDRNRFKPLLICIDGLGVLSEEALAAGLDPLVLGRSRPHDPGGIVRLASILRKEEVSIVHGWLWLPGVFARLAGVAARVPVRIFAEGGVVTTMDSRRARRNRLAERLLAPLTDAYIANSEAVAAALRADGIASAKIAVVPNGVASPAPLSDSERRELRAILSAPPEEELVGMVARLDPEFKDHETLLAATAVLAREGRRIRTAIVGDGPARAALELRAAELGIADRVVFTGYRPDAARLIGAFDVSVLLSYSEGFSNVVLESMAAGVPLVATDIPPNREAVEDGVQGMLVPVRDAMATTAALRELLSNRRAAAFLAGAARRKVSECFSLDAQAGRTMELYERLLARKVKPRAMRSA